MKNSLLRKRLLLGILSLAMCCSAAGALTSLTAGAEETPSWTVSGAAQETTSDGVQITQETIGIDAVAVYSEQLDLKSGIKISYTIDNTHTSPMQSDAGEGEAYEADIMTFSFKRAKNGRGFYLRAYMLEEDASVREKRMCWDLVYYDVGDSEEYYAETLWTYQNIFKTGRSKTTHTINVEYTMGSYYITADGCTFVPKHVIDSRSFTDCIMTVTSNSSAEYAFQYTITDISTDYDSVVDGDWMDLGTSTLTYNEDGTMTYDYIDEELSKDCAGQEVLFLRNLISNTSGYDVTKKIEIVLHYDTSSTPGVWWAVEFPSTPYDNVTTQVLEGHGECTPTGLGSNDVKKNKGIMFQTTTGNAEPYYSTNDSEKRGYSDNGGGKSYSDQSMLNTITLEIGTESTKVSWNGKVLWDEYPMTQSDFEGGKVYPCIKFIETPANIYKRNTVTIKGINTPYTEDTLVKRVIGAENDVQLSVDDLDNGTITLASYSAETKTYEYIDSSLYSYNSDKKILTIKGAFFAAVKEEGARTYLIGNDGGFQPFTTLYATEFEALIAPEFTPQADYTMAQGAAEGSLSVTADLMNGVYTSFKGSGLTSSNFSYEIDEDNVITITLSQTFLNNLKAGERTITLTTTSVDGTETASSVFTIHVTDANGSEGGDGSGEQNQNEQNGTDDEKTSGCCSSLALGAYGILMFVVAATIVAVAIVKKRVK